MTSDGRTITDLQPVVVVGPMRTGTTLVAELLDTHPDVVYLGFELAEEWAAWTGLPWGAPGADDIGCPPLDADAATPARAESVRAGLTALLRDRIGDAPWPRTVVLKSPHFWHRLDFLTAVLPRARIVRTRRGLLPTVASLRRLWDRGLDQHGRVHHLPVDPSRCWDYVPRSEADGYDPDRTFPGGRVPVLAEFCHRVDDALDHLAARAPERVATVLSHEELVTDPVAATGRLQRCLGLPVRELVPPKPLDPDRLEEWRALLGTDERRRVLAVRRRPVLAEEVEGRHAAAER